MNRFKWFSSEKSDLFHRLVTTKVLEVTINVTGWESGKNKKYLQWFASLPEDILNHTHLYLASSWPLRTLLWISDRSNVFFFSKGEMCSLFTRILLRLQDEFRFLISWANWISFSALALNNTDRLFSENSRVCLSHACGWNWNVICNRAKIIRTTKWKIANTTVCTTQ